MNLSERLRMNVSLVPGGARAADIGCDHGYASIWLAVHGIADKVIAMDINKGPIERAAKHISDAGLKDVIECRQSDGMEKLIPGEVDTLMIAGMGGPLMIEILSARSDVLEKVNTLILQPQSEIGVVRAYLPRNGFAITAEKACIEDGKYYFSMKAERSVQSEEQMNLPQWQYRYGVCLIREKNPVLKQYLLKEKAVYLEILKKPGISSGRKLQIEHLIDEMNQCLACMDT